MKLVFSRKGFDSAAGGVPSPVIDGRPYSLPIPSGMPSATVYADLKAPLPEVMAMLKPDLRQLRTCHLDPDIDRDALPDRPQGWRGALGQVGAARSHLINQAVGVGDIFLFWGLFADVTQDGGRWRYCGPQHHRLFGWLEVGEVIDAGDSGSVALNSASWLRDHPHARDGWGSTGNSIYLATERSGLVDGAGYGVFRRGRVLSAGGGLPKSVWKVPAWLHPASGGAGMSFHPQDRWLPDGLLKTVGRGQEFVADIGDRQDAKAWVRDLLDEAA